MVLLGLRRLDFEDFEGVEGGKHAAAMESGRTRTLRTPAGWGIVRQVSRTASTSKIEDVEGVEDGKDGLVVTRDRRWVRRSPLRRFPDRIETEKSLGRVSAVPGVN